MAALDDFDGEPARGPIVCQAYEQLGHSAVLHRLRASRAVAPGETRYVRL